MKAKKLFAALIAICLCLIATFTACEWGVYEPTKLATPEVVVSEDGVASWGEVEHAFGYKYVIDGGEEKVTTDLSVALLDGQSIKVKAFGDGEDYVDSDYSAEVKYEAAVTVSYGLPAPAAGHYMKNADVIEDVEGDVRVRYLTYITNETAADSDNVVAVRKAIHDGEGFVYGEEKIILRPSEESWDLYIGSASIVKGEFALNGEEYSYLLAYHASSEEDEMNNQIGLACAKAIDGEWIKLDAPVISYNPDVYGKAVGCYSPALVNYNKVSGIRLFYTYADKYGHFGYFFDADMSDLGNIDGVWAQMPSNGNLSSGDMILMFPNGDFAYDAENAKFYGVKDYSPEGSTEPKVATKIEAFYIAESDLYTTDETIDGGWRSVGLYDGLDLGNGYERVYNASIISDAYGHVLSANEIVYTVAELKVDNADYLYTQHLLDFIIE